MPTIKLLRDKEKPTKSKRIYKSKVDNLNHKVYNSKQWRELRLEYLKLNPLCEKCELENNLTLANEVHHIIPISVGNTFEQKKELGYNPENLMALCSNCHKEIHND